MAKLIVWGSNRTESLERMKRSLDEFVIEGVPTTIPFHRAILNDKHFYEGNYNTSFLENFAF